MEQPEPPGAGSSQQLAARVRSFQHDALVELFARSFDDVHEFASALTADRAATEEVVETAFRRALDRLADFHSDATAMTAMILALAEEAIRHLPPARFQGRGGVREAVARLPAAEHEAITLRLVAGLDADLIAAVTARRPASVLGSELAALRALSGSSARPGLALPAAQRQLDSALERLLDGEEVTALTASAPGVADAGSLLAAASGLVSLTAQPAPPEVRARIRNHYLAAAEARRVRWVQRHQAPAVVPGRRPRPRAHALGTGASLVLAAVLAIIAGAVLAFAANFSTPSSAVYPLKRGDENVLLALTFDRVARANLDVKLSEERLREAETEAATRHGDRTVQAVRDRYAELRAAAAELAAVRQRDAKWKQVRDYYMQQASEPVDPLERLLGSNGMEGDAAEVARSNQQFQNDRKTLDRELGAPSPAQPAPVPSGAPSASPLPSQ